MTKISLSKTTELYEYKNGVYSNLYSQILNQSSQELNVSGKVPKEITTQNITVPMLTLLF